MISPSPCLILVWGTEARVLLGEAGELGLFSLKQRRFHGILAATPSDHREAEVAQVGGVQDSTE